MLNRTCVIGVGRRERGDDGVGAEVVRLVKQRAGDRVRCLEHTGDGMDLPSLWSGTDLAIVVDAVVSGRPVGTLHRLDVSQKPLAAEFARGTSSHALGVAEAVELSRAMGSLPQRLLIFGVEGAHFEPGKPLDPRIKAAVPRIVDAIFEEITRTGFAHA